MRRLISLASIATTALLGIFRIAATANAPNATVTVMTQNVDAGTDLKLALAYLNTSTTTVGIDLTTKKLCTATSLAAPRFSRKSSPRQSRSWFRFKR